ncbi:MAG: YibE/F family protein [Clostridia bacterium]|nr:YibE/F family protein [Clostridia bacterium]
MPKNSLNRRPVRALIVAAAAILLLLLLSLAAADGRTTAQANVTYLPARVLEISSADESFYGEGDTMRDLIISFTAKLESGDTVTASQTISDGVIMGEVREVTAGDRVILMNNAPADETPNYVMTTFVRTDVLIWLGILFALLLIVFGRSKGLAALLALALTCAAVFCCFVPSVLAGKNIYLWTLIVCAYITIMTLLLIGDTGRKSLSAILGCLGGTLISAAAMALSDRFLHMTGHLDETTVYLLYLDTPAPLDLRALLYAAILIGALGAVMDVSVDISSSLCEIAAKLRRPTFGELFRSGITIGRDLIGTMSNTLILAYIGSSLSVVLLIVGGNNASLFTMLNQERIVFEILQALVGSFGILSAIPLTAAVSALLFGQRKEVRDEYAEQLEAAERAEKE